MPVPLFRTLPARVNLAPGSFLGREVVGLPGPIWSMMAWYLLVIGLMLARLLYSIIVPNDVGMPGLTVFRFAYAMVGLVALAWMGARTPGWVLFLLVDLNIAVTCLVAASQDSIMSEAVPLATLVVAALYAATWFGRREMVTHLAVLTVLSAAVAFLHSDSAQLRVLWAAIVVLCWGLGWFVNSLVLDLSRQVMSDPLTALLNRTGLDLVVASLSGKRARVVPRSVAVLDLDNFKAFNDRHGHHAGDEILQEVGAALSSQLRSSDIPARTGGDEFVVVMPSTNVDHAHGVLARIIASLPIGCSVGVSEWPTGTSFDEAVQAADREMYTHKRRDSPSSAPTLPNIARVLPSLA